MKTQIRFEHGLGDCVYFAHQLPLYQKRGIDIELSCPPDKEIIFKASQAQFIQDSKGLPRVPWHESHHVRPETADLFWTYNKAAINLSHPPLPYIGTPQELWAEMCTQQLDLRPWINPDKKEIVQNFLETLPRPIVLVHTMGNTGTHWKNLPVELSLCMYQQLLDTLDGTLILLDWDNRVPRMANWRVRHLTDDWQRLDTESLLALLYEADLFLGIDSGPLHAARFTSIPTVSLFPHVDHYPTRWCLPRQNQVNLVTQGTHALNRKTRVAYNIIESAGPQLDPIQIAQSCVKMLEKPRYLEEEQIGRDVLLQQFVREWERGHGSSFTPYVDRDRSYDLLLREASRRFSQPTIVETGCIRCEEDWGGAGYSTYLLGTYVQQRGGRLLSVDISSQNCEFARRIMKPFSRTEVFCEDSVQFLSSFTESIDVLLIDSVDTEHPHAPHHALAEVQAAVKHLHQKSLILLDDTPYSKGHFLGKGTLAVPWLLQNGWEILFSGYQTLLHRPAQ